MRALQSFLKFGLVTILLLMACGDDQPNFAIDESKIKDNFTTLEALEIKINSLDNAPIDSIQVILGTQKKSFKGQSGKISLENFKFGIHGLSVDVFSNDIKENLSSKILITSPIQPQLIEYELVNTYPHESNAYTQGYEFYNNQLYEGTGQLGRSSIRITDAFSGKVVKMENLPNDYFGEGITILNDTLYQLTWKNQKAIIYDAKTLSKIKEVNYPQIMEGWGLTNDGNFLYMTDGTENLYQIDAKGFKIKETIPVYSKDTKIDSINELEWVNGKIYANVYTKDAIIIINPKTGSVEAIVNLSELKKKIDFSNKHPQDAVLNGIAYHPLRKTFFVTGKDWEKTFEIRLKE
jgi:glutamine cyclotransferase